MASANSAGDSLKRARQRFKNLKGLGRKEDGWETRAALALRRNTHSSGIVRLLKERGAGKITKGLRRLQESTS